MRINEIRLQIASTDTLLAAMGRERAALQAKLDALDRSIREQEHRRDELIADLDAKRKSS